MLSDITILVDDAIKLLSDQLAQNSQHTQNQLAENADQLAQYSNQLAENADQLAQYSSQLAQIEEELDQRDAKIQQCKSS